MALLVAALLLPLVALGGDIRIVEVKGTPAEVIKPNGTILPARVGDHLQQGTTVKTPQRSSVMFLLSNGALLALQSSSELLIQTFDAEPFQGDHSGTAATQSEKIPSRTDLRLDHGLLLIDSPSLHGKSRFHITTPLGGAGLRGTALFVLADPARSAIGVSSGNVLATDISGKTMGLLTGEATGLAASGFVPATPAELALINTIPAAFQSFRKTPRHSSTTPSARPTPTPPPKSRAGYRTVD